MTRLPEPVLPLLLLAVTLAPAGTAAAAAAAAAAAPDSFVVPSAVLREDRRINVYTPPGYEAGEARYPVLYMPDGGLQEDFPHVTAAVDAAIRAGEMRPFLVVGIENTERRRDTTGPTAVEADRQIAPRVGGSAAFRRFLRDELMPEVERRYRVTGERAVIGESLAGLFIVETFFLEPELFDAYVALSPSLWWNAEELVRKAAGRLAARPGLQATLYLSSADEENIAPAVERLAGVFLTSAPAGLRWRYEPRPDLTHATIYRAVAPQVLRTLFAP